MTDGVTRRVTIKTRITGFGRSSFEVEHRLLRGEALAVRGIEKRVLVSKKEDGNGIMSCPIPDEIKKLFQERTISCSGSQDRS